MLLLVSRVVEIVRHIADVRKDWPLINIGLKV